MNIEELFSVLHQNPECNDILSQLDDASQKKVMECLRTALLSENAADKFIEYCGEANLIDFGDRLGSKDKGKLTPINIEKFANELIKALKQSPPQKNEKNKK